MNADQISSSVFTTLLVIIGWWIVSYVKEKGKSLATKEDIAGITHQIEEVKSAIGRSDSIFRTKYELKVDAYMAALKAVDSQMSHFEYTNMPEGATVTKQYMSAEDIRKVHNELLISVDNVEIINVFLEIMFGPGEITPTEKLNKLRNLIREDLKFGELNELNKKYAWFAKVPCEPKPPK